MIGHLLIEGSSTAAGVGDEAGKMGYAGRLFYRYMQYNDAIQARHHRAGARPGKPQYVYVRPYVGIDNCVQCYAPYVAQHVEEARAIVPNYAGGLRVIGLFAIGGYLDYWAKHQGRQEALDLWQTSLEKTRDICRQESIRPLLFNTPRYEPGIKSFHGNSFDEHLHFEQRAITEQVLTEWGAPYVTFEDIVGDKRAACIAPDGKHPNAQGYDRITEYFIPLINKEFGIEM